MIIHISDRKISSYVDEFQAIVDNFTQKTTTSQQTDMISQQNNQ